MTEATDIRLVISDIDGTLVRSDKTLSDATMAAVQALTAAGVPMTLISARPPSGMSWIAKKLTLAGPFGAFNGGVLFGRDGAILERHCLGRDVAKVIVALLLEAGITCWLFADGEWLASDDDNPHMPREILSAGVMPIITGDFSARLDRVDKIVGVSDDVRLLAALEAQAMAVAGQHATIERSQPHFLDITAFAANKGDGVAFLARAFDVSLAQVAVIGDQANDVPMFARAGLSIVMGQAPATVKAKAMLETDSNDADGVARAIERMLSHLGRAG